MGFSCKFSLKPIHWYRDVPRVPLRIHWILIIFRVGTTILGLYMGKYSLFQTPPQLIQDYTSAASDYDQDIASETLCLVLCLWVRYRSGSGGARTHTTSHVVYKVTDGHRSGVFLLFGFLTTWSDWFGASSCNNMCILKGSVGIRVSEPTSASQWQCTETSLLENTWNPTYMILTADLPKVQGFTCFFWTSPWRFISCYCWANICLDDKMLRFLKRKDVQTTTLENTSSEKSTVCLLSSINIWNHHINHTTLL